MPAPTQEKTWEFSLNNSIAGDATLGPKGETFDRRNLLFALKEELINNGGATFTAPWAVTRSSNGSDADASDNWVTAADVLYGDSSGNAHSWIVLFQAATGMYMCWDWKCFTTGCDGASLGVWVSRNAFTGGSTTTRPTASEEMQVRGIRDDVLGAFAGLDSQIARTFRWHMMLSSDGECTRILIYYNNFCMNLFLIETLKDPPAGWTEPWFVMICGESADNVDSSDESTWWSFIRSQVTYHPDKRPAKTLVDDPDSIGVEPGALSLLSTLSLDFNAGNPGMFETITTTNPVSGEASLNDVTVFNTQAGSYGYCGKIYDLYTTGVGADGDDFPSAQPDWIKTGNTLVLPWDGVSAFSRT